MKLTKQTAFYFLGLQVVHFLVVYCEFGVLYFIFSLIYSNLVALFFYKKKKLAVHSILNDSLKLNVLRWTKNGFRKVSQFKLLSMSRLHAKEKDLSFPNYKVHRKCLFARTYGRYRCPNFLTLTSFHNSSFQIHCLPQMKCQTHVKEKKSSWKNSSWVSWSKLLRGPDYIYTYIQAIRRH